jgi:hypothetical protein
LQVSPQNEEKLARPEHIVLDGHDRKKLLKMRSFLQAESSTSGARALVDTAVEPGGRHDMILDRVMRLGCVEGYLAYLKRDTLPGGCFLTAASAEFDGRRGRYETRSRRRAARSRAPIARLLG